MNHSQLVTSLVKPGQDIINSLNAPSAHLLHMILGLSGEVGELLDALKKAIIYQKELDLDNIVEELGDIEFYLEGLRQGLKLTREQTLTANISKLQARYSRGSYSDKQAQERADK